jgi:hypothetical protein
MTTVRKDKIGSSVATFSLVFGTFFVFFGFTTGTEKRCLIKYLGVDGSTAGMLIPVVGLVMGLLCAYGVYSNRWWWMAAGLAIGILYIIGIFTSG